MSGAWQDQTRSQGGVNPPKASILYAPRLDALKNGALGAALSATIVLGLYSNALAPWVYFGFPSVASPEYYVASVMLSAVAAAASPKDVGRPSTWAIYVLLVLGLIPSVTIMPQIASSDDALVWASAATFLGFMLMVAIVRALSPGGMEVSPSPPSLSRWDSRYLRILGASSLILIAVSIAAYGLHFEMAGMSSMYEMRLDFREQIASEGALESYAVALLTVSFGPILLGLGIVHKKAWAALLGVSIELYSYSMAATKTSVLLAASVAVVALVIRFRPQRISVVGMLAVLGAPVLLSIGWELDSGSRPCNQLRYIWELRFARLLHSRPHGEWLFPRVC